MGGIRKFKHRKPKNEREPFPKGGYKDIVRENAYFEAFYKDQPGMCPPEEYEQMIASFKTDLPASFRVTGFRSQAFAVRDLIEGTYFTALSKTNEDGEKVLLEPPRPLPWIPDRLGWQLSLTRKDIRREEALYRLHNFLISETESGNISRQEAVSMIPPIVLDVRPHHKVLDLCAAPGSKTAQLIEAIHSVEDVVPEGLVVANDSDNSRCYMLVHQAKRLQSPCVVITNHDASIMPNIQVNGENGELKNLKFDRVLCDVPCSGDGTLRKNADIWPKWNAGNSTNLHGIQYRILRRGLELLEVGGRLVYSTCSLNPIENEAVVQRMILDAGKENVVIEDASHLVPGLKFRPGLTTWKVGSKDGDHYEKWDDVKEVHQSQVRPAMFPCEEVMELHLERCIRILPHQQDTGGFFVAVLTKKALCDWESKGKAEKNNDGQYDSKSSKNGRGGEPPRKKPCRHRGFKEDPYIYFDENEQIFKDISECYGIKGLEANMFLTRCKDANKKNSLYYTSKIVRDIVLNNIERVKIINTGVKAFTKCENKGASCDFRLAQEGALMTIPFMTKRIVRPTRQDLEVLLMSSDLEKPPEHDQLDEETKKQLAEVDTGSVALVFEEKRKDYNIKLEFVGWKGKSTLRAYVPKNERVHYLRLIGSDTSKYEKNKFEERRAKGEDTKEKDEDVDEKEVAPQKDE